MTSVKQIEKEINSLPAQSLEKVLDFILFLKKEQNTDTEYLSSIKGMKESIINSSKEPLDESVSLEDIGWE